MTDKPKEDGSWDVQKWDNNRVAVCSSDFTHDVCLMVTGDFADIKQKMAYAEIIAERLNTFTPDNS